MTFFLGVPEASWLARMTIPAFVSYARLRRVHSWHRATCMWALDSGGFSELSIHGTWTIPPKTYAAAVVRARQEIGAMEWAAVQDWMCEPFILSKTGRTVRDHQARTVESFLRLRDLAPDVPWLPVLQGYQAADYLEHVEEYARAGVDLQAQAIVGLGSVCRRQASRDIRSLTRILSPISLHGFGVKSDAYRIGARFASSDSMAWSAVARRERIRLPGHTHQTCSSCPVYAIQWRERVIAAISSAQSAGPLFEQYRGQKVA